MSVTQFKDLPHGITPLSGFEKIPCAQVFQPDDVFVYVNDIVGMPVQSRQEPSTDYTAQLSDVGVVVELTGANPIVRIPHDSVIAWVDGSLLQFQHFGTGRARFIANFGVVVSWPKAVDNITDCTILRAVNSPASLRKRVGLGLWAAEGDLVST